MAVTQLMLMGRSLVKNWGGGGDSRGGRPGVERSRPTFRGSHIGPVEWAALSLRRTDSQQIRADVFSTLDLLAAMSTADSGPVQLPRNRRWSGAGGQARVIGRG